VLLFATPDCDMWRVYSSGGFLFYTYTLTGHPLKGISSFLGTIDKRGYLHLILKLHDERHVYSFWEGQCWYTIPFPFRECERVHSLVVDNNKKTHVLVSLQGEALHLIHYRGQWFIKNLPFKLYGEPLCVKLWAGEYLFVCWEETKQEVKKIFYTFYQKGNWFSPSLLLEQRSEAKCYVYFIDISSKNFEIYSFVWEPQEGEYQLYCYTEANIKSQLATHILGKTLGFPDSYPLLLSSKDNYLLCWTVNGQFTFSLKVEMGSWSRPQGDYLFFPTSIKPLLTWNGWEQEKAAFMRVNGLDLNWPLIIGVDQILPYCKAVLTLSSPFRQLEVPYKG